MEFHATGYELNFTPAMTDHLEQKIEKLAKYLDDVEGGRAVLKREGHLLKLEITIGGIRSSASGEDYYTLVVDVIHQLERQIRKYNQVRKSRKRNHNLREELNKYILEDFDELPEEEYQIYEKKLTPQMMYKEDAIEMMELLGHSFFVYTDAESLECAVVYKRFDGDYGLLSVKE